MSLRLASSWVTVWKSILWMLHLEIRSVIYFCDYLLDSLALPISFLPKGPKGQSWRNNFLWGGLRGEFFKFRLVEWNTLCSPIKNGIEGEKIRHHQSILIWGNGCGVLEKGNHFWRRVIGVKYGEGWGEWTMRII